MRQGGFAMRRLVSSFALLVLVACGEFTADMQHGLRPEVFKAAMAEFSENGADTAARLQNMRTADPHVFDTGEGLAVFTFLEHEKAKSPDLAREMLTQTLVAWSYMFPDRQPTDKKWVQGFV